MIKSEMFSVKSDAMKASTVSGFSITDLVKSVVRNHELQVAQDRKSYTDSVQALENAHPGCDVMTIDVAIVNDVLKEDAGDFLKARTEILNLKEEVKNCLPIDKFTMLPVNDRVHITILAHTICKGILLNELFPDVLNPEKGGVDLATPLKAYYEQGKSAKALKETLRPAINKVLGSEGMYFYPVKIKKADLDSDLLMHFVAAFGGDAKKEVTRSKSNVNVGSFNYVLKASDKKVQLKAFTDLVAVIYDNACRHNVVRELPVDMTEVPAESTPVSVQVTEAGKKVADKAKKEVAAVK